MKTHFCRMLAYLTCMVTALLVLGAGGASAEETASGILEAALGSGYQRTTVLEKTPRDDSTLAFPVSAARALYPADGNYKKIVIHAENIKNPIDCWIIPDESVTMQAEVTANDDVGMMMYWDSCIGVGTYIADMLDPEAGIYTYEQSMPGPEDPFKFLQVVLFDSSMDETQENEVGVCLIKDEADIDLVVDYLKAEGNASEITWEYAEKDVPAKSTLPAYIIHVVDQNNLPVEEVMVNFCTDTACVPRESDENGKVIFTGVPDVYHVQIVDGPEGYSWDENYDLYTAREYGEWVLRIRKD